jgi:hypothetical protein
VIEEEGLREVRERLGRGEGKRIGGNERRSIYGSMYVYHISLLRTFARGK